MAHKSWLDRVRLRWLRPFENVGRFGVVGALLTIACGKLQPCADLARGDEILVSVIGPSESTLPPSRCEEDWGFTPGAELVLTVRDFGAEFDCESAIAEVSGLPDSWSLIATHPDAGGTLESWYRVTRGECEMRGELRLSRVPCDAASGTCWMWIQLSSWTGSDATLCPQDCSSYVDVRAEVRHREPG